MKLQLTHSELCEILSKSIGATVDSVKIVDKTKENQKNSTEILAIVREFPKAHNPDNLTPEQYGFAEGYRLLGEDEIKDRPLCHSEIELWDGSWSTIGYTGCSKHSTYRTKLSREELAKLS